MSYWDTSALGKLYIQESDSDDFERKAAGDAVIVTLQPRAAGKAPDCFP